ncbi:fusaric acid resistance protein FusB/ fusaricacid resistance protein FusC [Salmonella enterica subsp. enterica]|uniref:Fusaric acid resistance protein FusB/ fusaricacid resistance protein FusC n=1 Tax=Salmonella enterica I TaxID=59201 RepID=A0A3S4LRC8_SALET|nr:fusaric acid resistance protein FusB/ fusaricacid resistance protein FusC [Salmonella enterica subsp. enterica]
MVMIAVVTSLAMRLPNPRMVCIDFIYGTLAALPLGLLYFLVIIPNTPAKYAVVMFEPGGIGVLYRH